MNCVCACVCVGGWVCVSVFLIPLHFLQTVFHLNEKPLKQLHLNLVYLFIYNHLIFSLFLTWRYKTLCSYFPSLNPHIGIIFTFGKQNPESQTTLTGQFISYPLLVPGWSTFCLQSCLNGMNPTIPYWFGICCTSVIGISPSTTSQRRTLTSYPNITAE